MAKTEDILQLERQRSEAMMRADAAALERLFDENLSWTHSSAKVDTRKSFIDTLNGGSIRYLSIDISEHVVRLHGNVAIATGIASMRASIAGEPRDLRNRFTATWAEKPGGWRMIAWQSTPSPKP